MAIRYSGPAAVPCTGLEIRGHGHAQSHDGRAGRADWPRPGRSLGVINRLQNLSRLAHAKIAARHRKIPPVQTS
jgi:hypothetical protein